MTAVGGGNSFPKAERLCGKTAIARLLSKGKYGSLDHLRFCFADGNGLELNRLMVSVPKKNFKRAVRRNLLKRRLREAYRTRKRLVGATGVDIMLSYTSKEIADFETIRAEVEQALILISERLAALPENETQD